MAGKKRKAADSSSPHQTPASTKQSQRIKPSVELIEISSDRAPQPALRGVLRGLSLNNVLPTPKTQQSVEQIDVDDDERPEPDKENRHMTRGVRNGRTDNPINYDAKYHPMDQVTRPRSAGQRLSGSRSISAFRERDDEASGESVPSSARWCSEDGSSRFGDASDVEELPPRIPDPKATRRSTRAEANKSVNYSRKHHPQDHSIPGHQHKAKQSSYPPKTRKRSSTPASPEVQIPRGFKNLDEGVVICDSDDDEPELGYEQPPRPHKKLRTLSDDRSSPQKPKRKHQSPKKAKKATTWQSDRLVDTTQDIEDYSDHAFAGGVKPRDLPSSDWVEAVQELNELVDNAELSSPSGLDLAKIAAKQQRPIAGVDRFASETGTDDDTQDLADQYQSHYRVTGENEEDGVGAGKQDDEDAPDGDDDSDGEHHDSQPTMPRLSQPKAASEGDDGTKETPQSDAEGRDPEHSLSSRGPHLDADKAKDTRFASFGRVPDSDQVDGPTSPQHPPFSGPSDGGLQEAMRNALKRPQSGAGLYRSAARKTSSSSRTFVRSSTHVELSSSALKTTGHVDSQIIAQQRHSGAEDQVEEQIPAEEDQSDHSGRTAIGRPVDGNEDYNLKSIDEFSHADKVSRYQVKSEQKVSRTTSFNDAANPKLP